LIKLGVEESLAATCGSTGKDPWHSSKTEGIQKTLTNEFLKSEGLYSLPDGWIKFHHSQ